jgi:hypothetical protein
MEIVLPSLPLNTLLTYFDPSPSASICLSARKWHPQLTNNILRQVLILDTNAAMIWSVYGPNHEQCVAELRSVHRSSTV